MRRLRDITGQKYGRILVLGYAGSAKGRSMWFGRCDCGTEKNYRGSALTSGNSESCGCAVGESMAEVGRTNGTHRLSRTIEYNSWHAMMMRCYNPKNNRFRYYGAKGVKVCDRWRNSFENFLEDMGKRPSRKHSIDRYPDTNGDYEPTNCRWATPKQQNHNRRPFKHSTKLSDQDVRAIRADQRRIYEIARDHKVSWQHIKQIKDGVTRRNVPQFTEKPNGLAAN